MEHPSNPIDNLFRQRLQQAEVPPPAFVWPAVERSLRRRKRRGLMIWLLGAGLAATALGAIWYGAQQRSPLASQPALTHPQDQELAAGHPSGAAGATTSSGTLSSTATPGAQAGTDMAATMPDSRPEAVPGQPALAKRAAASPRFRPKGPGATPVPRKPALAEQAGALAPSGEPAATNLQASPPDPSARLNPTEAIGKAALVLLPGRLLLWKTAQAPVLQSNPWPFSPRKKTRKCYDFHANRQAWLLDAYAGPTLAYKSLFAANPEFNDYVQDRLGTEKQQLGFNAGVRASYLFAGNFILRTGLHYDQFTEKFEYIDPNYIKYTVEIIKKYVNGQWVSVPDTVKIEYGANYQKTYNRYGLLDIPLQGALELRSGAGGLSLNLGGSLNLLFWKRGHMLEEQSSKPVAFTPRKQQYDVFKTKVGLSLIGSIQWFYHLDPRTRIFAEPYYRHILNPVTRPEYPVEQSHGVAGIRFGLTRILETKIE